MKTRKKRQKNCGHKYGLFCVSWPDTKNIFWSKINKKMALYFHRKINSITCVCGYVGTYHACGHIINGTIAICLYPEEVDKREYYDCIWQKKWRRIHCLWKVYGKVRMSGHLWGLRLYKMWERKKEIQVARIVKDVIKSFWFLWGSAWAKWGLWRWLKKLLFRVWWPDTKTFWPKRTTNKDVFRHAIYL